MTAPSQSTLFGPPEAIADPPPRPRADWPEWYTPGARRGRQNRMVARGLHPMGAGLGPDGETCGSCKHSNPEQWRDGRYIKCAVMRRSRSEATDIRLKWRACARWEPAAAPRFTE